MAKKRDKAGWILLGVFLGFVLAASFIWWQQNVREKNWFSFGSVSQMYHKLFDSQRDVMTFPGDSVTTAPGKKKATRKTQLPDSLDAHYDSLLMADSLNEAYLMEQGVYEYYIESGAHADSLPPYYPVSRRKGVPPRDRVSDSLEQEAIARQQKEIIVKREQFLQSRLYQVQGLSDTTQGKSMRLDSLLTEDYHTLRLSPNTIRIEFWRSPINYSGYKFSGNRLILFGNFEPDKVSLEIINRHLYLHHRNQYYILEPDTDFQAMAPLKKL